MYSVRGPHDPKNESWNWRPGQVLGDVWDSPRANSGAYLGKGSPSIRMIRRAAAFQVNPEVGLLRNQGSCHQVVCRPSASNKHKTITSQFRKIPGMSRLFFCRRWFAHEKQLFISVAIADAGFSGRCPIARRSSIQTQVVLGALGCAHLCSTSPPRQKQPIERSEFSRSRCSSPLQAENWLENKISTAWKAKVKEWSVSSKSLYAYSKNEEPAKATAVQLGPDLSNNPSTMFAAFNTYWGTLEEWLDYTSEEVILEA